MNNITTHNNNSTTTNNNNESINIENIYSSVKDLTSKDSEKREIALLELSKNREKFSDLAPIIWYSVGTITALLQEIITIYPLLSPPNLTAVDSNRVCNALALLQCVASHPETRSLFIGSQIPLYLYPFLNTQSNTLSFEYLRLTSLGVIGALVKMDDSDVISFLLTTEIIPLCLRIMQNGSELSKTVATFIVQKILLDDKGLNYICATYERFCAVSTVLASMVTSLTKQPSQRLLKHIIRCYLKLCDNPRAKEALRPCLPEPLRDGTFSSILKDDSTTKRWLATLLMQVPHESATQATRVNFNAQLPPQTINSQQQINVVQQQQQQQPQPQPPVQSQPQPQMNIPVDPRKINQNVTYNSLPINQHYN